MHLLARGALLAVLLGPPLVLLCDALHAQRVLILLRLHVDLPALHVRQDTLHAITFSTTVPKTAPWSHSMPTNSSCFSPSRT